MPLARRARAWAGASVATTASTRTSFVASRYRAMIRAISSSRSCPGSVRMTIGVGGVLLLPNEIEVPPTAGESGTCDAEDAVPKCPTAGTVTAAPITPKGARCASFVKQPLGSSLSSVLQYAIHSVRIEQYS